MSSRDFEGVSGSSGNVALSINILSHIIQY